MTAILGDLLANWKTYVLRLVVWLVVAGAVALGVRSAWTSYAQAKADAALALRGQQEATARAADLRKSLDRAVAATRAANQARAAATAALDEKAAALDAMARRITGLDCTFRLLHDAAASGRAAPAEGALGGCDAPPVDPKDLAVTLVENYRRAEANRQQVLRLQKELQDQAAEDNTE